jgi:hypothetical protein
MRLDLRTKELIYDTNVIQRVLPIVSTGGLGDDSYDEEIFIINIFEAHIPDPPAPPPPAPYFAYLTALPYHGAAGYFNSHFSPYEISLRWFGAVPFSIYNYLGGSGTNDVEAHGLPNSQPTYIGGQPPSSGYQYQYIDFAAIDSDPAATLP